MNDSRNLDLHSYAEELAALAYLTLWCHLQHDDVHRVDVSRKQKFRQYGILFMKYAFPSILILSFSGALYSLGDARMGRALLATAIFGIMATIYGLVMVDGVVSAKFDVVMRQRGAKLIIFFVISLLTIIILCLTLEILLVAFSLIDSPNAWIAFLKATFMTLTWSACLYWVPSYLLNCCGYEPRGRVISIMRKLDSSQWEELARIKLREKGRSTVQSVLNYEVKFSSNGAAMDDIDAIADSILPVNAIMIESRSASHPRRASRAGRNQVHHPLSCFNTRAVDPNILIADSRTSVGLSLRKAVLKTAQALMNDDKDGNANSE